MGHDHSHGHHTNNGSKAKFGVIFSLLLFFGLSVTGNQVFVASKEAPAGAHIMQSEDAEHEAVKGDEPAEEQHKPAKKKH